MSSIKLAIGSMVLVASVLPAAAQAGMCQWKDEKGVTHFAAHCPLDGDAKIEARYTGGTVPLNKEPAPSLIIEQANRSAARQAAEASFDAQRKAAVANRDAERKAAQAKQDYIDKLLREARGNGRGLNQSFSDMAVDKQRRHAAERELDRLSR